ncbi:MAG: DUF2244 domain-containing protein, partial [Pseudomonadota bacterium]
MGERFREDDRTAGAEPPAVSRSDPPIYEVTLWPHRSLSDRGFVYVMVGTAVMLALPLIPLLGTPVALGLLPFMLAAL